MLLVNNLRTLDQCENVKQIVYMYRSLLLVCLKYSKHLHNSLSGMEELNQKETNIRKSPINGKYHTTSQCVEQAKDLRRSRYYAAVVNS